MRSSTNVFGHSPGYVADSRKNFRNAWLVLASGGRQPPDEQVHSISRLISVTHPRWDKDPAPPLYQVLAGLFMVPSGPPPTSWLTDETLRWDIDEYWLNCQQQVPAEQIEELDRLREEHNRNVRQITDTTEVEEAFKQLWPKYRETIELTSDEVILSLALRLDRATPEPWSTPDALARNDTLAFVWHLLHQQLPQIQSIS